MIKHEFVFDGGVAKIKDIVTGAVMLEQPGLPGPEGITPWANEQQASDWVHAQFDTWFADQQPAMVVPEPLETPPAPDDSQPPNPPPTQQGSGA